MKDEVPSGELLFAVEVPEGMEFITLKVGTEGATRAQRRTDISGLREFLERFARELGDDATKS